MEATATTTTHLPPPSPPSLCPPSSNAPEPQKFPKKPGSCNFFLKRKQRYCTVPKLSHSQYCGNHLMEEGEGYEDIRPAASEGGTSKTLEKRGNQRRIVCPLDPGHTIYERYLKSHLRICNVKKEVQVLEHEPFYRLDINAAILSSSSTTTTTTNSDGAATSLPSSDAQALLTKIVELAQEKQSEIFTSTASIQQITEGTVAASILSNIEAKGWAEGKARHAVQQASLISHLARRGLIHETSTCVEMGAGRGTLGGAVHLAFPDARVLLVERAGVKFKADAYFRRTGEGGYFERYRIDIKDLWIRGLPSLLQLPSESESASTSTSPSSPPTSVAFMGKHVCGVATDFSLRAFVNYLKSDSEAGGGGGDSGAAGAGIIIATCCYHVCQYKDFVGKEIWEQELGFTAADFAVAQKCACWVSSLTKSCGPRSKGRGKGKRQGGGKGGDHDGGEEEKGKEKEEEQEHQEIDDDDDGDDYISYGKGITTEDKVELGWCCKSIIDLCRLQYLRSHGLTAECVKYCEPEVSPENSCIVAYTAARSSQEGN